MVSTFTPNINLEEPARGDQVGTWDTPVNANMTLIDLVVGGPVSINLNNSPVVLASAQYQCSLITFASTLTGSCAITFPSTFKKSYTIRHTCTGSSAFIITLQTTVAGGQIIACRPGNPFQCYNDGTNLFFVNLGTEVGGYWDYAGSSVPNWVSGCTVPPYLNADGTVFSSATYPQLAVILPGLTLPNSKGKSRFALDQGAGLISSAAGGFSGATVGSTAGGMTTTLGTSNLPAYTPSGTIASSAGTVTQDGFTVTGLRFLGNILSGNIQYGGGGSGASPTNSANYYSSFTGAAQGGVAQLMTNLPPAYIGGLSLIRSA